MRLDPITLSTQRSEDRRQKTEDSNGNVLALPFASNRVSVFAVQLPNNLYFFLMRQQQPTRGRLAVLCPLPPAVSYTHLDVYKRQK